MNNIKSNYNDGFVGYEYENTYSDNVELCKNKLDYLIDTLNYNKYILLSAKERIYKDMPELNDNKIGKNKLVRKIIDKVSSLTLEGNMELYYTNLRLSQVNSMLERCKEISGVVSNIDSYIVFDVNFASVVINAIEKDFEKLFDNNDYSFSDENKKRI